MNFTTNKERRYKNTFLRAKTIQFIQSGDHFFKKLILLIQHAKESIQIQTFIFDDQETGQEIAAALIAATKRKVAVDLVVDAFGSRHLSNHFINSLKEAGIQFRFFSPISIFKNLNIGRRLHHKVAVFDGKYALVGGINLANKYRGTSTIEPWLDFAVLIHGNVCQKLKDICFRIEEKSFSLIDQTKKLISNSKDPYDISIRQNDWLRNKKQIFQSYILAIQKAETSITIFGSYFLPGLKLRMALEQAAKRGVNIQIVLAGKSDIPLLLNATYYLYSWLHKHKIKVYEWNKSVLHAKLAVIDEQWMTIGSFNLNHLSKYASIELNVDILNTTFVTQVSTHLNGLIKNDCEEILSTRARNLSTKIRELFAYFLGRTLIKAVTFFPNFRNIYSKLVD